MKQEKEKNSNFFVNRTTKNSNSKPNHNDSNSDSDSDEINELSTLINRENIDDDNNNECKTLNTLVQNNDEFVLNYLVNSFNIVCSDSDNLCNISYIDFKKLIQESNINRIQDINKFYKANFIQYNYPHIHFKKEWICYGDLLFNKVYTYEESKKIIKSINKNIDDSNKWIELHINIISEALDNKKNIDIELLDKIIYIPQDPKNYYIDIWNNEYSWSDFLGVNIIKYISINDEFKNSSSNIDNDRDEFIKSCYGDNWFLYNKTNLKTNLSILKKYIDEEFKIDSSIDIIYSIHNNGNYNTFIVEIRLPYQTNKESPIIITKYNKVLYDKNYNLNIYNSDNYKCNKSIYRYLLDEECRFIISNIDNELRDYINHN